MAAAESIATGPYDRLPSIVFATDDARFVFDNEESATDMRLVIAQLGHAEWGLVASETGSTLGSEFTMMIDTTFWFCANEILRTLQFARHSAVPHANWTRYEIRFASAIDFADCARAVAEAKSHVLYHHARMVDALVDAFEQQFPPSVTDENANGQSGPVSEAGDTLAAVATTVVAFGSVVPQDGPIPAESGESWSFC